MPRKGFRACTRPPELLFDEKDRELIESMTWCVNSHGYAVTHARVGRITFHLLLHRILLSPPMDMEVDHINGDRLDCRRSNMRIVTHRHNRQNQGPNKGVKRPNRSGYRGVSWVKDRGSWLAQSAVNGKPVNLGRYDTREEAAQVVHAYLLQHAPGYVPERGLANEPPKNPHPAPKVSDHAIA